MSVLGRILLASAERVDLQDFASIDSYVGADFKYLLQSFVGSDKPYILKGFDVIDPENAIGSPTISIRVADSIVYYPGSSAGCFFHGLPAGNVLSTPIIPTLRKNATNYVYAVLSTFENARDTRSFWDPDLNGGEGAEFSQDVNTESVLKVELNVSISGYPSNVIPICKVVVGPSVVSSIEDNRDLLFRLGNGGINSDPFSRYQWKSEPSIGYERTETPIQMSSSADPNAFFGGDKNISSLKEWMDAIMSKIAELGGTTFWYENSSLYNTRHIFEDTTASFVTSKGSMSHSISSIGSLIWNEDIHVKYISDQRDLIIRANTKALNDNEVLYTALIRDEVINAVNGKVNWFSGANYVNGSVGYFTNLSKGDFIKKRSDLDSYYLRVEEFYADSGLLGGVTTAALAKSIKLVSNYPGLTESQFAAYTKGSYEDVDMQIVSRGDSSLNALGSELFWIASRCDTKVNISNIASVTIAVTSSINNGQTMKFTAAGHGLADGEQIIFEATSAFYNAGTAYTVEVEDANTFYIKTAVTTVETKNVYLVRVTTSSRSTSDGYLLESANHSLNTGDKVIIADTSNYNGSYIVTKINDTNYSFALGIPYAAETSGTSTIARIKIRTSIGTDELVPGESALITVPVSDNIRNFVGQKSPNQSNPIYEVPTGYNAINGFVNYNCLDTDNLTARISKLTSMMADKAQDKTIGFGKSGYDIIKNITSGGDQLITFTSSYAGTPTLNILMPGSPGGSITLSGTLTLAANQVAYFSVDRDSSFSVANLGALTVASITELDISENIFIFAYRLSGTMVWLWNNVTYEAGITYNDDPIEDTFTSLSDGVNQEFETTKMLWYNNNTIADIKVTTNGITRLIASDYTKLTDHKIRVLDYLGTGDIIVIRKERTT